MSNWTNDEVKKTMDAIRRKALTDEAFFALCMKDPKKAVKEVAGKEVPAEFKLKFIENKADEMVIVLPTPVKKNAELSEKDLENVAGGAAAPTISCPETYLCGKK